jgi:hypothetical protein
MLWRPKLLLEPREASANVFDFIDHQNGQVLASAQALKIAPRARSFWSLLGLATHRSPAERPQLLVQRPKTGEPLFKLRQASGLMYDSRRVYDGEGQLIAHFRSQFKTTLRGGIRIIDLRGQPDDGRDISQCPSLGNVTNSGNSYELATADHPRAGRMRALPKHRFEIEPAPEIEADTTGQILLLAAALSLAWQPEAE